eukprot:2410521-Prymnesium_polylepis.1
MLLLSRPTDGYGCVAACAALNATPACVQSQASNDRVRALLLAQQASAAWLGVFQYPTDEGSLVGWQHLCDPRRRNYTNWGYSPRDNGGLPESCALAETSGEWDDEQCAFVLPCACEEGGAAPDPKARQALDELVIYEQAWAWERIDIIATLCPLLVALLMVLNWAWHFSRDRVRTCVSRRRVSELREPDEKVSDRTSGRRESLEALLDAKSQVAAKMRRQVVLLCSAFGWLLAVLGYVSHSNPRPHGSNRRFLKENECPVLLPL